MLRLLTVSMLCLFGIATVAEAGPLRDRRAARNAVPATACAPAATAAPVAACATVSVAKVKTYRVKACLVRQRGC